MKLKIILRQLISDEGISISQLSRKTKIPVQTLHNWLSGTEPRSLKQVRKVANYFSVTIDYLCFGIQPKPINDIENFHDEINAGVFEVVLRKIKRK